MDRTLTCNIDSSQEGTLLLDFLRSKGFSRNILASMKPDKTAIMLECRQRWLWQSPGFISRRLSSDPCTGDRSQRRHPAGKNGAAYFIRG